MKVWPVNQFASLGEAETLVAMGEAEQRDRRLYQVLKCHGPGFCPWMPRSWSLVGKSIE